MAKTKLLGSVTPVQAILLKKLYELNVKNPDKYYKPKELGSFRGSPINVNLTRFKDKNWVESSEFEKGYRITDEGRSEYLLIKDIAATIDENTVFGLGETPRISVNLAKAKKIFAKAL